MPKPTPNPQAVEAAVAQWRSDEDRFPAPLTVERRMSRAIHMAEPHIRSQLLTELAKTAEGAAKFENAQGRHEGKRALESVVEHCRELAAKEESDG